MQSIKLSAAIILSTVLLFACSCNTSINKAKENNTAQTVTDSSPDVRDTDSSIVIKDGNNPGSDTSTNNVDTSTNELQNTNADSMLAQGMTAMFGKNDSGILKNLGGGKNMDSMMKKLQSMMGSKNGNPGDAISNSLLNFQLGQMSDNNPLKSVTKGMMAAQKDGTAGPSKTYTSVYTVEQPTDFTIPVSGNGNTIMLQYTGGSIANNKKDGLWKNIYISTNNQKKWNVYSEAYAESSALNMKVHATLLSSVNENYSINLNDQYKKYYEQQRSDVGKNESDVQVQKIGSEKIFGYNCMHVKVIYTIKGLGQTAHEQDDEWYCNEVPGAQFLSPVIFENHSPAVVKKIMDARCSGALVKSVTASKGSSNLIQLTSVTKKERPDSIFNLPANYQEDKNTVLYDIQ
ncbi:MAG: DUF4412 domain-containing protein [Ferruginibacter sp.]